MGRGPALDAEDAPDRQLVARIGAETVDRLGGNSYQSAAPQNGSRLRDGVAVAAAVILALTARLMR